MTAKPTEINQGTAYALWALGFFVPVCGIHRFYAGKPISGTFYLLTFGLFYVGQFLDVFFIPSMVKQRNRYFLDKSTNQALLTLVNQSSPHLSVTLEQQKTESQPQDPMIQLLQAASENKNALSVAQAMISLGLSLEETEKLLVKAVKKDLAHIGNDPDSGAVRYYFDI
ncbi:MAG: TM2 domain-containing protein [Microcystaceae cyanobacterium]